MTDKQIRVDAKFDTWIKKMIRQRMVVGKDMTPKSSRRLTRAIIRHRLSKEIERDILSADLDLE